jgi:mRNA interferase HigB
MSAFSTLLTMRIAARNMILAFYEERPDRAEGKSALEAWCHEARTASWATPADVRAKYRSAIFIKGGRVIFNICEMCRLVARLNYAVGVIYVRFVGTPTEFDNINAETV